MNASDVLERALELIRPAKGWTKSALARNERGYPVPVGSSTAVRFCATGAIDRVAFGTDRRMTSKDLLKNASSEAAAGDYAATYAKWAAIAKVAAVARSFLLQSVQETSPEREMPYSIPAWNDALDRTHKQVVQAFERAVELAKEAGR